LEEPGGVQGATNTDSSAKRAPGLCAPVSRWSGRGSTARSQSEPVLLGQERRKIGDRAPVKV